MALGPSVYTVNGWLNALFNATAFSVAQAYIQLHTAEPGRCRYYGESPRRPPASRCRSARRRPQRLA